MSYKVIKPLVVIPAADGKTSDWYGYEGALVPDGHNDKRVKELAREGFLEKVKDEQPTPEPVKEPTIDEILAEVGNDKTKAAAALETEKAGKGRSTLISKLEAIVNAG